MKGKEKPKKTGEKTKGTKEKKNRRRERKQSEPTLIDLPICAQPSMRSASSSRRRDIALAVLLPIFVGMSDFFGVNQFLWPFDLHRMADVRFVPPASFLFLNQSADPPGAAMYARLAASSSPYRRSSSSCRHPRPSL